MTLIEFLRDAKKAAGAAAVMAATATAEGITLGGVTAAVTAGAGIVTAGIVWWLNNEGPVDHAALAAGLDVANTDDRDLYPDPPQPPPAAPPQ